MNEETRARLQQWGVILDDAMEEYAYRPGRLIAHTLEGMPPSSAPYKSRRITATQIRQACGAELFAILGGQFSSDDSSSLIITVAMPLIAGPEPYGPEREKMQFLDFVADWLIAHTLARADMLTRLGSGCLQIDRIGTHPVDSNEISFRIALMKVLTLFSLDLSKNPEATVRRALLSNPEPTFDAALATPGLIAALHHERPGVRSQAAAILRTFDLPEARQALNEHQQA